MTLKLVQKLLDEMREQAHQEWLGLDTFEQIKRLGQTTTPTTATREYLREIIAVLRKQRP
jgi:hypothetical protein